MDYPRRMLAVAAAPPQATLVTAAGRASLAISSWCWGTRCGAPIAASKGQAVAKLGETVRVELRFVPKAAKVDVGGVRMRVTRSGRELSWVVRRGGGVAIRVTSARGWVSYVGRLRLG
jgi:hypothetical protein